MPGRATRHSTLEKMTIGGACLVVLFGLAMFGAAAYMRSAGKTRLENLRQSLAQEGIVPLPSAVIAPPDKEAVANGQQLVNALGDLEALRKAHPGLFNAAAMRHLSPGEATPAYREEKPLFDSSPSDPAPKDWEELRRQLTTGDEAAARARSFLRRGVAQETRYDFRPASGPDVFGAAQTFAGWLRVRALLHLHDGDLAAALEDLNDLQQVASFMGSSHTLIASVLEMGIWGFAVKPVAWEILQAPGLTEEDLGRLHKILSGDDFARQAMLGLQVEVSTMIPAGYRQIESGSPGVNWTYSGKPQWLFESSFAQKVRRSLWLALWKDSDQAEAISEWSTSIREAQRLAASRNWTVAKATFSSSSASTGTGERFAFPIADLYSASDTAKGLLHAAARVECARQLLLTAIALERWKLKHGDYPATLDSLIPGYLGALPPDWYDGGTLKYRRLDSGEYLLYSVGENGTDEGGDATSTTGGKTMENGRDIVWPRAAHTAPTAP